MHSSSMHEPFNWLEDEAKKLTFVHMMCTIIAIFLTFTLHVSTDLFIWL